MQRRRTVRKIIQEPQAIVHRTNIQRRNENNAPIRTTNNQAIAANVSRNYAITKFGFRRERSCC